MACKSNVIPICYIIVNGKPFCTVTHKIVTIYSGNYKKTKLKRNPKFLKFSKKNNVTLGLGCG